MIELHAKLVMGAFELKVSESIAARATALYGVSGAGKSTCLKVLAGLVTPESGRIAIGSRTLYDSAGHIRVARTTWPVGHVPQNADRLIPTMSVVANLERECQARKGTEDRDYLTWLLSTLDLGSHLSTRVASLSSIARRRAALAQALVTRPAVLACDEPLIGFDQERLSILPDLKSIVSEQSIQLLYVTHNVVEIMGLADRVMVLHRGRVRFAGAPGDYFTPERPSHPATMPSSAGA